MQAPFNTLFHTMKLYLLTQHAVRGYDTYDSLIVCAQNEEEAKKIRPDNRKRSDNLRSSWRAEEIEDVQCKEIWLANKEIKEWLVLASFNAW